MASGIRKKKGDIVMDKTWDDRIKQIIKTELDAIEPDAQAEKESLLEIHRMVNERRSIMKITKRKMAGAIAAALAIMVMGTATVVAAGRIKERINIPARNEREMVYSSTELLQKAGEQMGTVPKLVDTFSNGLAFKEGYIIKVQGVDENQNEVTSYPEVDVAYGENSQVSIYINEQQAWKQQELVGVIKKEIYKGITLIAEEEIGLTLPEGTQPSEEDLKLQEEGRLTINYGSSEEEREVFRCVIWSENGMDYALCAEDMEVDDLIGMAKEIIDVK